MPDQPPISPAKPVAPWWAAIAFGALAVVSARYATTEPATPRTTASPPQPKASMADGRGRHANTPSELPLAGWRDILMRVYEEVGEDRVLAVSAGVTFYSLLALFPAIVAIVSLYGLFADANSISELLNSLNGVLPGGALEIIGEQVKRIASKPNQSLGIGFAFGLVVALWSANAGMKALFDALNIVYGEKEKRGFFVLNAVSLLFTVCAVGLLLLALGAVVVIPIVLAILPLGKDLEIVISLLRWPVLLVMIAGGLTLIYRYGPSRRRAQWRWLTWGSTFAAVGWVVASILFSWYVSAFGSYNATYGSLGAAIGFMTWLWISITVVLIGAELNGEMEHQTMRDTTRGPEKPMGKRGAVMADTVGH